LGAANVLVVVALEVVNKDGDGGRLDGVVVVATRDIFNVGGRR
jgi:hypothetical protein